MLLLIRYEKKVSYFIRRILWVSTSVFCFVIAQSVLAIALHVRSGEKIFPQLLPSNVVLHNTLYCFITYYVMLLLLVMLGNLLFGILQRNGSATVLVSAYICISVFVFNYSNYHSLWMRILNNMMMARMEFRQRLDDGYLAGIFIFICGCLYVVWNRNPMLQEQE